jgi:hypothetical protein
MRSGWVLSYQHTGSPADAVFTRNALHQVPDFWKALALDRIAQLLRPGGILRLHDLIFDFRRRRKPVMARHADRVTVIGTHNPRAGHNKHERGPH